MMKNATIKTTLTAGAMLLTIGCMSGEGQEEVSPETLEFRQAMISGDDVAMDTALTQNTGVRVQALNAKPSAIARLTGEAVVGTNAFLKEHFDSLEELINLPPKVAARDKHVWEGSENGVTMRVSIERTGAPRGVRYEYHFSAKRAGEDFKRLLDGYVTRIDTRPNFEKQGWGIVRVYFTNLNAFDPANNEATGTARVAFRRVGDVRQVRARLYNLQTPDEPDFPRLADYEYTLLPNNSGALRWYARQDFMQDGAPLERVVVHSAWRDDRSGVGNLFVQGGSLAIDTNPVEYLSLTECWSSLRFLGFERAEVPGYSQEEGSPSACYRQVDDLELPVVDETAPEVDPEIPPAHPDEQR